MFAPDQVILPRRVGSNLKLMDFVPRSLVLAGLLAVVVLPGCSRNPQAQKQRFLASGDKYFQQQNYAAAAIEYRNAVQLDARFGPARLGLARAHERLGHAPQALNEYVRAADLLPEDRDVQLTAAAYLLAGRRFDEAKARAEGVLKQDPRNVRAQVLLGNALAGLQDMDQAIAEIEEAIRLDPLRGATYTNLGILQMSKGKVAEAEAAFQRTVELEPKW